VCVYTQKIVYICNPAQIWVAGCFIESLGVAHAGPRKGRKSRNSLSPYIPKEFAVLT
jgi:hypothetical protein